MQFNLDIKIKNKLENKILRQDKNSDGYILVFSMIFIAVIVMLSTIISNRGMLHVGSSKIFIAKEKAKMLAYSGLQLAMAQLAVKEKKEEGAKKGQDGGKGTQSTGSMNLWTDGELKEFIKTVLPNMYKWQEFKITKDKFGIEGTIRFCICSEEGKLDINGAYDFENKKFYGQGQKDQDYKALYENICKKLTGYIKSKDIFKSIEGYLKNKQQFEKILKNRQNLLYEGTEFFALDAFNEGLSNPVFVERIFYEPIEKFTRAGRVETSFQSVYWTDIFTVFSGINKVNPFFISPSLKKLLGFKDLPFKVENIVKKIKQDLSFPADWKEFFEPAYGVKYESIPAWFKFAINTHIEPRVFSILAYGEVDGVVNKIFAIIERKKSKEKENIITEFDIKKLYFV